MNSVADRLSSIIGERYRIEREIGQGGMAIVYLAEDIRHRRKVAIKVLHPELSAVLGPERFLKEIELTANLQHPSILPLFDSGAAEGLLYYVMPFVEGETLRDRLDREHQISINDTVRIACDVAGALDYAHKRGVIHRDIKPENILLQDGRPVVADFGIALAVSAAGGNRVTQTGISLGTPQYMSPEQATGDRQIDGRSDIYSLGAVTYEMLTGDPPHTGSSTQAVIAKVITEKPTPIHAIRSTVPRQVEFAVDRALAKAPVDRWTTAHEFIDALEGRLAFTPASDAALSQSQRIARWIPWVIASIAVIALATYALRPRNEAVPPLARFTIESVGDGSSQIQDAAISPDGQTLAIMASKGDSTALWIRRLDDLNARRLVGSEGALSPFFSPDGKTVGYLSTDGMVRKLPLEGGTPTVIGKMSNPTGIVWLTPDTIIGGMIAFSPQMGLSRLSTDNAEVGELTKTFGNSMHHDPIATPGRKSVLFMLIHIARSGSPTLRRKADLGIASLDGNIDTVKLTSPVEDPIGFVGDKLIYLMGTRLWSVPIDLRAHKITGKAIDLGEDAGENRAQLSENGTLIYTRADFALVILLVRNGLPVGSAPDTLTISRLSGLVLPQISPDGQAISFNNVGNDAGVYVFDRKTRELSRLTTVRSEVTPTWSPDSRRIMTRSAGENVVSWISRDASTPPETIAAAPPGGDIHSLKIAPDGRTVLMVAGVNGISNIYVSRVGGKPVDATMLVPSASRPQISDDGKWLIYDKLTDGTHRIIAQRYPTGGTVQISEDEGAHPVWPLGSNSVYYEVGRDVMSATLDRSEGGLQVVSRRLVWHGKAAAERSESAFTNYDVSRNGDLVAVEGMSTGQNKLVVELNWGDQLKKKK